MAHGLARARTVLVPLRSMTARVLGRTAVRRLLIVGGFVLAGWLLGGAGQAHADTTPGPATGLTGAVLETTPDRAVPAEAMTASARPRETVRRSYERAAATVTDSSPGLIQGVVTSVRRSAGACLPRHVVTGAGSATGGSGMQVPGTPRRDAVAGPVERPAIGAEPSVRPTAVTGGLVATTAGGEHTRFRTGAADPMSPFGPAPRTALDVEAAQAAGSAPAGGAVGQPARLGIAARPSTVLVSAPGAIPPAGHAATDEPALSPD